MRFLLGLLVCVPLIAADFTQLRQLEENDRIFDLRRAIEALGSNDAEVRFYRGVIAARFGHELQAIPTLQQFLADQPDPHLERWGYQELASAFERLGRYGEAAQAWGQSLSFTPKNDFDRRDTENTRALNRALRDIPPQRVQLGKDTSVQAKQDGIGSWNVPIRVNESQGEWIFDTGANVSTIIESEAKRMGLTIRETGAYVRGSTGARNPLRIAVARDLRFGDAQFSNVVFLVLEDAALKIDQFHYQIRGILGLPVIRALGYVEVSAEGAIQVQAEARPPSEKSEPNLFFDELSILVEVRHNERPAQLMLDTGANKTILYPSFRSLLSRPEIAQLTNKREKTAGAGGMVQRKTDVIPTLQLDLPGRAVDIQSATFLSKQPKGSEGQRDGVLGMDGLARGFTLDFRSMQVGVQ